MSDIAYQTAINVVVLLQDEQCLLKW